jgi:hypothetical protein
MNNEMTDISLEEQLAQIQTRKEQLEAQKQLLLNKDLTRTSKEDTRLKVLIGTAVLADLSDELDNNSSDFSLKKANLKTILDKHIHHKLQREFLQTYGFIDSDADTD